MKSSMGELTDPTNRAETFALMPVVWALGASMGLVRSFSKLIVILSTSAPIRPLLGGTLARPSDHFPTIFTGGFWREYPYYLPCLAVGIFVLLALIIVAAFFKEVCFVIVCSGFVSLAHCPFVAVISQVDVSN